LSALVSASQENDEFTPSLLEIDPVTGAEIDSQLGDTFADGFRVAWIAGGQALNSGLNSGSRLQVARALRYSAKTSVFRISIINRQGPQGYILSMPSHWLSARVECGLLSSGR